MFPGQSCRAACLVFFFVVVFFLRMGDLATKVFWDTSTEKNNGMQDSHTHPLVISFFVVFLIENKDSDIQALSPRKHPTAERIGNFTEDVRRLKPRR